MDAIGWIFAILIFVVLLLLEYHTGFENGRKYEKYVNKLEEEQKQ